MADEIKLSKKVRKQWDDMQKEREVAAKISRDAYMRVHNMEQGLWKDLVRRHNIEHSRDWVVDMRAGVLRRRHP